MKTKSDDSCCPYCGIPFSEHSGIVETCKRLLAIEKDADMLFGYQWQQSVMAVHGDPHDAQHHQIMAMNEEIERLRSLLSRVPHVHWDRYAGNCASGCLRCEIDRMLKGGE